MSGGSYDYAYMRVLRFSEMLEFDEPSSEINNELRLKFARHLEKVAAAMKAIEWVDSNDCEPGYEDKFIKAVLEKE